MDRTRRAASKVIDFRKYHLSGDLDQEVQGIVTNWVTQFEMSTAEELKQQLEQEKEQSRRLQEDAELMKICNELEMERLKQQQWKATLDNLTKAREQAAQEHDKCMAQMEELVEASSDTSPSSLLWLKAQIEQMGTKSAAPSITPQEAEHQNKERQERQQTIKNLHKQQEEIKAQLAVGRHGALNRHTWLSEPKKNPQEDLMQQLKAVLSGKQEEDPNRTMLKALTNHQNKAPGEGGTNTLKPSLLRALAPGGGSMAEWLANLNKQEEGESELNKFPLFFR